MTRKDPLAAIRSLVGLRDTPAGRYAVEHLWPMNDGTIVCSPHWPERQMEVRLNPVARSVSKPKSDLIMPLYPGPLTRVTVSPLNWLKAWCLDRAQWFAKVGPYRGNTSAERTDNSPPIALLIGHVNGIDWSRIDSQLTGDVEITTGMLVYSMEQHMKRFRSLVRAG